MTIRWSLHIVSLPRFSFCWWRHNRLLMMSQWPDNCDTITWIVISNLVDIDFIHGNIHGQSCKKKRAFTPAMAGQRQRAVVLHEFTDSSGSCCAAASASIYAVPKRCCCLLSVRDLAVSGWQWWKWVQEQAICSQHDGGSRPAVTHM